MLGHQSIFQRVPNGTTNLSCFSIDLGGFGHNSIKIASRVTEQFVPFILYYLGFLWSTPKRRIEIRENGTEIVYNGEGGHDNIELVKADRPIPREGQFYYEVSIVNSGENNVIAIGICSKDHPRNSLPGNVTTNMKFHSD